MDEMKESATLSPVHFVDKCDNWELPLKRPAQWRVVYYRWVYYRVVYYKVEYYRLVYYRLVYYID